jgi:hypothetical protein
MTRLQELQYKEYVSWITSTVPIEIYNRMNDNTVRQQLNIYLNKGKINFFQLQQIIREVDHYKLMKDLTTQERELILQYIKKD